MKSRSEVLAEKAKKASAAERTVPLPLEKPEKKPEVEEKPEPTGDTVTCPACEEKLEIAKLEKREDGSYECSECAAPIPADGKVKAEKPKADKPKADKPKKDAEASVETRTGSFCGDCGAEWPVLNGKTHINCGHTKALRVDDPRKATNMKGVTASGVANPPDGPPSVHTPPSYGAPIVAVLGNRISIGWGKTTFPFGEITNGPKYANFDIPSQIITVDLPEGADRVDAARSIIADLQKIADLAFDTQYAWYKKKLRILDDK